MQRVLYTFCHACILVAVYYSTNSDKYKGVVAFCFRFFTVRRVYIPPS